MLIDSQIRLCKKKCRIKTPFGTIPCPWLHAPEILNTQPELNNITSAVAIEKLEELKTSGQATKDDYPLLGYFYTLENKYDQSKANTLLDFPTDDARKATIEQLEVLKTSGQATKDYYPLLGYFYSLEKKYDKSEANYLTALELATDDGTKAIIEQELKKVRDVMQQPKLGGETKL
jgi:hypothetical protein